MKSLIELEIAVLQDNTAGVRGVLDEIDRRTENAMFTKASEVFGFPLVESLGEKLANRADLARVFGYVNESGLRKLAEKYQLPAYPLGGYVLPGRSLLMQTLGLSKFTNKTVLVTWQTFLVAGMAATTAAADQVKLYLLQAEKAARIGAGALDLVDVERQRIDRAAKIVSMVARADRIRDANLRQNVLIHLNGVLDGALRTPRQGDLFGSGKS